MLAEPETASVELQPVATGCTHALSVQQSLRLTVASRRNAAHLIAGTLMG